MKSKPEAYKNQKTYRKTMISEAEAQKNQKTYSKTKNTKKTIKTKLWPRCGMESPPLPLG